MLSLSRCPTKKRRKKKSSSLSSSVPSNVAKKCSIAFSKSDDDDDYYDDKISRSSTDKNCQVLRKKKIDSLKENQNLQVQLLKRKRECQKRRKMRMTSAFESILKPPARHSDSSELKRMERLFWNDDDLDSDDFQKQNSEASSSNIFINNLTHSDGAAPAQSISGAKSSTARQVTKRSRPIIPNFSLESDVDADPLFEELPIQSSGGRKRAMAKQADQTRPPIPSCSTTSNIERNTEEKGSNVDGTNSPPSTITHDSGVKTTRTDQVLKTRHSLDSSASQEIADYTEDPKFSRAKKTFSAKAQSVGEDVSLLNSCQDISAGEKSARIEQDCRISLPKKKKVGGQPSSIASGEDDEQPSFSNEPESGDVEFRAEQASLLSCLQTNRERHSGFQCGLNGAALPDNNDDPRVLTTKYHHLQSRGNQALNGKLVFSKQSGHKAKNEYQLSLDAAEIDPSREGVPDKKKAEIPQSARNVQMEAAQPSFCGDVEMQSAANTRRELVDLQNVLTKHLKPQYISTAALALTAAPADGLGSLHDELEETCLVQRQGISHGSSEPKQSSKSLVSKSKANKPQSSPIGTAKVKAVAKEEKVASSGNRALPKKKPSKGFLKKTQVPAMECIDRDCDPDQIIAKKPQLGTKRGRGLCALCTTCPCRKLGCDGTIGTLGLNSFARSDGAIEKALIRRLKKIEKSSESLQDQQEAIKRKLKKHRRKILRKKTKISPEDKDTSYFLPDAEELESSECKPFKLADNWVTFAQNKMFPSALDGNQQSLTQLGFLSSKSNKSLHEVNETPHAPFATPHEETIEIVVDDSEIAISRCAMSDDKIENEEDSEASYQELTTEIGNGTKDPGSGYETPRRISWRSGSKLYSTDSNDIVAASALEGLIVHPEEVVQVDDANSVLSLANQECPMGRTEPCPWDSLFTDCAMGDEICDMNQLLMLIDDHKKSSLHSTQESSTCRIGVVGDSGARQLDLTYGRKEAAKGLITKISSDVGRVGALNQVCPNWKENVSFAFGQSKEDLQKALQNLQESQRRLDHTKEMVMGAWDRNKMTMDVFKEALEKSLDQHGS